MVLVEYGQVSYSWQIGLCAEGEEISIHIANIFKSNELNVTKTCRMFAQNLQHFRSF